MAKYLVEDHPGQGPYSVVEDYSQPSLKVYGTDVNKSQPAVQEKNVVGKFVKPPKPQPR